MWIVKDQSRAVAEHFFFFFFKEFNTRYGDITAPIKRYVVVTFVKELKVNPDP